VKLLEAEKVLSEDFPYGSFAVALYASEAQVHEGSLNTKDLLQHASQGARVLGLDEVQRLHDHWLRLNRSLLKGRMESAQYQSEIAKLWPDTQRFESCLAADLGRLGPLFP
jgi:branched-subunit amino acid aminotransferase/4-amino-4-deoxychorismate lyase